MQQSKQSYLTRLAAGMVVATLASGICVPASAQEVAVASGVGPAGVGAAAMVETRAHVIAIDPASNSVTLRGPRGGVLDVMVNPEVGDVSKLQIGDTVDIAYRSALLIHADKVKSNGIRERVDETATIPASQGVTATAHRIRVLATVEKVDVKKRQVTLRGPVQTWVIRAAPDVPLSGLKVGDSVRAELETATAVQVTRNGAAIK
jgi:Cu/Ag efflux protein CusF